MHQAEPAEQQHDGGGDERGDRGDAGDHAHGPEGVGVEQQTAQGLTLERRGDLGRQRGQHRLEIDREDAEQLQIKCAEPLQRGILPRLLGDLPRLLLVHVAADDAECRLVEPGIALRLRAGLASSRDRFVHEPGDVVVEEGQGLLVLRPERLRPRPAGRPGRDDALDDEPVGGLDEEDLAHPALVDEGPDRAEDLLEVLARTSLIDAHRASLCPRMVASSGFRRCCRQEPVVWSNSPRSFARRSLARRRPARGWNRRARHRH